VPISNHHLLLYFELLDQVKINASFEDEVLEGPDHVPDGWDHVSDFSRIDLQLVLHQLHPFDLVSIVVPDSLSRLLNDDTLLQNLLSLRSLVYDLLQKSIVHSLNGEVGLLVTFFESQEL
jgi:hypothetical protein